MIPANKNNSGTVHFRLPNVLVRQVKCAVWGFWENSVLPQRHFATLREFALELAHVRQSSSMTLLSLNRNLKEVASGQGWQGWGYYKYIIIIIIIYSYKGCACFAKFLNVAKWQSGIVARQAMCLLPGLGWLRQVIHKHRRQLLRAAAWDKGE